MDDLDDILKSLGAEYGFGDDGDDDTDSVLSSLEDDYGTDDSDTSGGPVSPLRLPKTPKPPKKGVLSQAQMEDILRQAGWDEKHIPTMSAIGMAESSGKTGAYNPGVGAGGRPTREKSMGLWQINTLAHPQYDKQKLNDPIYNAKAALEVYKSSKRGFRPWGSYTDGRYKKYFKGSAQDPESYTGDSAEITGAQVSASDEPLPAFAQPRLGQIAQAEAANQMAQLASPTVLGNADMPYLHGSQQQQLPFPDAQTAQPQLPAAQDVLPQQNGSQAQKTPPVAYQDWLKKYEMPDSQDMRDLFNEEQKGLAAQNYQKQLDQQAAQSAQKQNVERSTFGQGGLISRPDRGPIAQRVMPSHKTAAKAWTDEQLLASPMTYKVDLTGVPFEKRQEYALRAVRGGLANDLNLTNEAAEAIAKNLTAPISRKSGNVITVDVPRSEIARVQGTDWVRAKFNEETEPLSLQAVDQARFARDKAGVDRSGNLPAIPGLAQMGEAESNVAQSPFASIDNPFDFFTSNGKSWSNLVDQESARLKKEGLSDEQIAEAKRVGFNLADQDNLGAAQSGIVGAGGRILSSLAGIMRIAEHLPGLEIARSMGLEPLPDEWRIALSKQGQKLQTASSVESLFNPGILNSAIRIGTGLTGDVPRLAFLMRLPGGATTMFAADAGLQSFGQGDRAETFWGKVGKGAATGAIFGAASKVGQAAESFVGRALKNPVFDKGGVQTAARQQYLEQSLGKTIAENPRFQALTDIDLREVIKNTPKERLAAKLFGEGAHIGTIGGGVFTQTRIERGYDGDPAEKANAESLTAALTMIATDLAIRHGADAASAIKDMAGKIYRGYKDGKEITATITEDGEVKLLTGHVPDDLVDVQVVPQPEKVMRKLLEPGPPPKPRTPPPGAAPQAPTPGGTVQSTEPGPTKSPSVPPSSELPWNEVSEERYAALDQHYEQRAKESATIGNTEIPLVRSQTVTNPDTGTPTLIERPTASAVDTLNQIGWNTTTSGFLSKVTPKANGIKPSFAISSSVPPTEEVRAAATANGLVISKHPTHNIWYISLPKIPPQDHEKARKIFDAFAHDLSPASAPVSDTVAAPPAVPEAGSDIRASQPPEVAHQSLEPSVEEKQALYPQYKKAFELPLIQDEKALGVELKFTDTTASGRSITRTQTVEKRQQAIIRKQNVLQKLVDCLHG